VCNLAAAGSALLLAMSATKSAFREFTTAHGPAKPLPARLVQNEEEKRQMTEEDGLLFWKDGPVPYKPYKVESRQNTPASPQLTEAMLDGRHLWTVMEETVPYAPERCEFGSSLPSGVVKHSNLTGGQPAYSGGEVIVLSESEVIVNGCSGRYGPRTPQEMQDVALAFRQSGYWVWTMGFDTEANRPFPFIGGPLPQWVP
jgi:hypothetical protein